VFLVSRCLCSAAIVALILGVNGLDLSAAGAAPTAAAAAAPARATTAAKPAAPGAKPTGKQWRGTHRYRRYTWHRWRRRAAPAKKIVAANHPAAPGAAKPLVAQAVRPPARPSQPMLMVSRSSELPARRQVMKPILVASRITSRGPSAGAYSSVGSAAAVVAPNRPAVAGAVPGAPATRVYTGRRRSWRRYRRPGVTHAMNVAAVLASPVITRGGNLVEPLSNGLTFSMQQPIVETRYGKPEELVGRQMRYTNFGVEYLANAPTKMNFVALQHDVRLNCKIGTGSSREDVEKVFGKLDKHDDVIYQKYLLHFSHGTDGVIDVITVAPAPGRPSF